LPLKVAFLVCYKIEIAKFMYLEARKLHLIEEILKINSESTLLALESLLNKINAKTKPETLEKAAFAEFSGIWSKEEAEEIERIIEETCETINPDD